MTVRSGRASERGCLSPGLLVLGLLAKRPAKPGGEPRTPGLDVVCVGGSRHNGIYRIDSYQRDVYPFFTNRVFIVRPPPFDKNFGSGHFLLSFR